jgi:O-antigen/teichoic acid export membrane protein
MNKKSSYRQIMKATSVFGGVQVFQILIRIIRSKFIAILLGPTGMGIAGLLSATTGLISGLTNFGLGTSAVKDISAAHGSGDVNRVAIISTIIRRLVWITGLLGAILTLVFSSLLSELTFGNEDYTYAFIWISITLLFNQISTGQGVLLRGMRKIRYLAQSSLIGSVLGLITTIPLYYFYGLRGIVPGIIVTSITSLLLSWYFANKIDVKSVYISTSRTIDEGKGMLKMGFMISLSGMITLGASYIVRIFISNTGGIDQVGLYNAGFAIINSYVGMIFTAMSTDYFPRLTAVAISNEQSKIVINQQAEIAILILSPIIIIFLVFINWLVILLYSSKFIEVNDMILWAVLGIFFKAACWSIGFIFLAKGATKIFFWNEVIMNIYMLGLNLICYYFWGLTGLGISFLVAYLLYLIQVYIVAHIHYDFSFNLEFFKMFTLQFFLAIICVILVKILQKPYSYIFGSLIIIISMIHAYKELNRRMDIISILEGIRKKINKGE